jgi:hypothetical protein
MVCPLHAFLERSILLERKQIPPPADNRRKKNYMEKPTVKKYIYIKKQPLNAQKEERNNFVKKHKKKKLHLSLHLEKTSKLLHRKTNHRKPRTQIF